MSSNSILRRSATLTFLATTAVSVPLVLGFFGDAHPAFDAFAHFRAYLAVLCAFGGLALLASRYWKHGLLAAALGAAALWTTLTAYPIGNPTAVARADPGERATYRLLQLNLWYDNPTPERVLSLIGRVQPDVVTLDELSARWRGEIAKISAMYPYQFFCTPRRGLSGTAVISRRPFRTDKKPHCFAGGLMAVASIELGGRALQVGALHMTWPWPFHQPGQLDLLQPALSRLGDTVLLAGDFNATAWSAAMRRIEADGGLTHVSGIGPTWLEVHLPDVLRRYAGLPIDQVLSKGEVEIVSVKTLEDVGSDHLPVLVEFAVGAGEPEEDAGTTVMLTR